MYSFFGVRLESNHPKSVPISKGWFTFKVNGKDILHIPIIFIPIVRVWESRIINLFSKYFDSIIRFLGFYKKMKIYKFSTPIIVNKDDIIQADIEWSEPIELKTHIELSVELFGEKEV